MDMLTPAALWSVASAMFGGGVAWGVNRNKINELRDKHQSLQKEVVAHKLVTSEAHADMIDRLARVETKIDLLLTNDRRRG